MRERPLVAYGNLSLWPTRGPTYQQAVEMLAHHSGEIAYVLGIDQAKRSGYALVELRSRRIVLHGWTLTSLQRRAALRRMLALPGFSVQRLLVVFEDHSTIPLTFTRGQGADAKKVVMGKKSILSLGGQKGRWQELLELVEHPVAQCIDVEPDEWRRVLSTGCNVGTEAWKRQAIMWATAVCQSVIRDDNEAEAIGIATWGAFDGLRLWACAQSAGAA